MPEYPYDKIMVSNFNADANTTERESLLSFLHIDERADLQYQLKQNLLEIKGRYASYVMCICLSLQNKGVTVKNLRTYLLSLDAFQSSHYNTNLKLLSDKEDKLEKADDIEDIFCILVRECASFLNYGIFQSIIEEYDIDTSQKKLAYPEHLKAYVDKHKLSEFYEINPELKSFTDDSKLVLLLNIEVVCTLGTLKERIEAIAKVLKIKPSALRLLSIEEGCVIVVLFLPVSIARVIFRDDLIFSSEQEDEFRALSVKWMQCNGYEYKFEDREQENPVNNRGMFLLSGERVYLKGWLAGSDTKLHIESSIHVTPIIPTRSR